MRCRGTARGQIDARAHAPVHALADGIYNNPCETRTSLHTMHTRIDSTISAQLPSHRQISSLHDLVPVRECRHIISQHAIASNRNEFWANAQILVQEERRVRARLAINAMSSLDFASNTLPLGYLDQTTYASDEAWDRAGRRFVTALLPGE